MLGPASVEDSHCKTQSPDLTQEHDTGLVTQKDSIEDDGDEKLLSITDDEEANTDMEVDDVKPLNMEESVSSVDDLRSRASDDDMGNEEARDSVGTTNFSILEILKPEFGKNRSSMNRRDLAFKSSPSIASHSHQASPKQEQDQEEERRQEERPQEEQRQEQVKPKPKAEVLSPLLREQQALWASQLEMSLAAASLYRSAFHKLTFQSERSPFFDLPMRTHHALIRPSPLIPSPIKPQTSPSGNFLNPEHKHPYLPHDLHSPAKAIPKSPRSTASDLELTPPAALSSSNSRLQGHADHPRQDPGIRKHTKAEAARKAPQEKKVQDSKTNPDKDAKKDPCWPAWVYCTRYSDRPSSGKRSKLSFIL